MKKSQKRAIEDLLTDENLDKVKDEELGLEFTLGLYHDTGRNREAFNEAINLFFDQFDDKLQTFDKNIELLKKQIENTKDLKKGIFQDFVKDKVPKLQEVL